LASEKFGQNRSTSGLPAMASARISTILSSREGRTHDGAMSPAPRRADPPPCWGSLTFGAGLATCFIRQIALTQFRKDFVRKSVVRSGTRKRQDLWRADQDSVLVAL